MKTKFQIVLTWYGYFIKQKVYKLDHSFMVHTNVAKHVRIITQKQSKRKFLLEKTPNDMEIKDKRTCEQCFKNCVESVNIVQF